LIPSREGAPSNPGKRTLAEQLPAQAKMDTRSPAAGDSAGAATAQPPSTHRLESLFRGGASARAIQLRPSAHGPDDNTRISPGGQGQPLPTQLQFKMGGALGADFSAVRVHEDGRAASLGALAYTQGTNIHFAPGQYQPDTRQGQELLGHELTHVVQQAQGRVQTTGQAKGVAINNDPALEHEADVMGAKAARGEATHATCGGCGACASCSGEASAAQRKAGSAAPQLQAGTMVLQLQAESDVEPVAEDGPHEAADGDTPTSGGEVTDDASEPGTDSATDTAPAAGDDAVPGNGGLTDDSVIAAQSGNAPPQDKSKVKDKPKAKDKPKPPPKIVEVDVDLSSQTMRLVYADGTTKEGIAVSTGKGLPNTKDDPCKDPNVDSSNCTPTGTFNAGKRGDAGYKNSKGDAMSWYVEFEAGRAIGIHNSQAVTGAPASHGCVRTSAEMAKHINQRVAPGTTKIVVSGKAPTKPWSKPAKAAPKKP
jgi:lipoprotein-anchoring transpeptidase ErfK/SrfK